MQTPEERALKFLEHLKARTPNALRASGLIYRQGEGFSSATSLSESSLESKKTIRERMEKLFLEKAAKITSIEDEGNRHKATQKLIKEELPFMVTNPNHWSKSLYVPDELDETPELHIHNSLLKDLHLTNAKEAIATSTTLASLHKKHGHDSNFAGTKFIDEVLRPKLTEYSAKKRLSDSEKDALEKSFTFQAGPVKYATDKLIEGDKETGVPSLAKHLCDKFKKYDKLTGLGWRRSTELCKEFGTSSTMLITHTAKLHKELGGNLSKLREKVSPRSGGAQIVLISPLAIEGTEGTLGLRARFEKLAQSKNTKPIVYTTSLSKLVGDRDAESHSPSNSR